MRHRHIILISGKDSLATALLQTNYQPQHKYEYVFNDTGCELPEVYDWLDRVAAQTGWAIERIGDDLEARIHYRHGFLPQSRARYCTVESKIQPFEKWLNNEPATVYYGLRADENRTGYVPISGVNITPAYPLRDANISITGVYSILEAQNLLPPSFFWQRLYDAVCRVMSDIVSWEDALTKWEWRSLFSGRTRANCYFCFFQQQIELLWLLETHPDYFWRMASFERSTNDRMDGRTSKRKIRKKEGGYLQAALIEIPSTEATKVFSWNQDSTLAEFADDEMRRKRIFDKKIKQICSLILQRMQGRSLALISDSEIALTSCGLLCGK